MKHCFKKLFSLFALLSIAASLTASSPKSTDLVPTLGPVTPYVAIRSQGYDAADELSGWTQHINLFDMDKVYGSFSVKPKYTRTFKSSQLCTCLFGTTDCNTNCGCALNVSGSRVANRGSTDLLADYFYLPTDYQSTLNFNPRIENALVDFNFYLGLDEWVNGLFFRVHLPVCWTKWNLNFSEITTNQGTPSTGTNLLDRTTVGGGYEPGYFAYSAIQTQKLLKNFASYADGCSPSNFVDPNNGDVVTTFNPLNFARINNCAKTKTAIADLAFILGYNFVNDCDYHVGLGLFTSAPTGTRPQAVFLFEPIVGNGKSWAFGVHFTSHAMLWRSEDEESGLGLFFDCNVTHLFNANQRRTFDIQNKPLSRYMLAEQMGTPVNNLFTGPIAPPLQAPNAVFQNVYTPVANLTTRDVQVSVSVQGDLVLQLTYTNGGIAWDFGYNYWGRSCETISFECNPKCSTTCSIAGLTSTVTSFAENTWALKGDASVYGQATINAAVTPIPLSATQTTDGFADITGGSNYFGDPETINETGPGDQNPQIDNKQLAFANAAGTIDVNVVASAPALQINTSNPAVFLKATDINNKQGTRGSSNKVYTHLSYQWLECEDWVPFFGIGGFAEFGNIDGVNSSQCVTVQADCSGNCTTCIKCSLSQWGVWAKFGVSFN